MNMVMCAGSDFMIRGVLKDHAVRLVFGNFADLVTVGILRHDTDPVSGRILGEALVSGALASVLLNEEERYSIRMDYDAPARGLMLDVSGRGGVRGFIRQPHVMTEVSDMDAACGEKCTVTLTKSENGRVLNSGQTESVFIDPDAGLSYFFSVSDQIETEIRSLISFRPEPAAPVRCAYGIMIQALPDCDLGFFNSMREKLMSEDAGKIIISPDVMPEKKIRELMKYLCKSEEIPALDLFEASVPRFICNCSAEKLWETAKIMLKQDDFEKLLEENPDPVIRCQFCAAEHHYRDVAEC